MTTNDRTLDLLRKVDAIITDSHFVYTSGKHGSVYIRKDRLYPHTRLTSDVCRHIAQAAKNWNVEVVVGPPIGGIILSQWTAYHLSKLTKREVLSVFTEKSYDDPEVFNRPQMFKRGYDAMVKDKRVLVVEDLTTTGSSVKQTVERAREAGGTVVGVYVLVNRNKKDINSDFIGAPFHSLAVLAADAYDAAVCPLCKKGIPVNTEVGHGKEYLRRRKPA